MPQQNMIPNKRERRAAVPAVRIRFERLGILPRPAFIPGNRRVQRHSHPPSRRVATLKRLFHTGNKSPVPGLRSTLALPPVAEGGPARLRIATEGRPFTACLPANHAIVGYPRQRFPITASSG
jgi:hypothetical protein